MGAIDTAEICGACGAEALRPHPPSRATGLVIQECPRCGLHALADRDTVMASLTHETSFDREGYAAYMAVTRAGVLSDSYREVIARLQRLVADQASPTLFDVGAGDGTFLSAARDAGFEPHGNELASGAIDLAREVHGIDLLDGDLSLHPDAGPFDAVTLWCVLAHVSDGGELLREVRRVMAPGGVVYLQTPRWSAMDRVALALHRVSGGRLTRITDRRMAAHHMTLHSRRSITELVERAGLEPIDVRPRARYSLNTAFYLSSLGVPRRACAVVGRVLDLALDRGLFFRNVFDVYATRPR